jgi:hypothetical protein
MNEFVIFKSKGTIVIESSSGEKEFKNFLVSINIIE